MDDDFTLVDFEQDALRDELGAEAASADGYDPEGEDDEHGVTLAVWVVRWRSDDGETTGRFNVSAGASVLAEMEGRKMLREGQSLVSVTPAALEHA